MQEWDEITYRAERGETGGSGYGRKKKLYIVEDDGNIRRELQSYLAAAGYQATAAEDFSNVAAQVLAAQPDLVLLGHETCPGISGLHILRADPGKIPGSGDFCHRKQYVHGRAELSAAGWG